jgi:hypothetical protein
MIEPFDNLFKTLMQLAQAAGVHQEPAFQQRLMLILQLKDPNLAKQAIDQLRPIVLQKLLQGPQIFEQPDPEAIDGQFPIGETENGGVFGLHPHELSMHTFITGSSGTGKSVIVQNLLEGLRRYNRQSYEPIHYWIFDFMAEYRHVLRLLKPEDNLIILRPSEFKFNPLQPPPGVDPVNWLQIFCDTLASTIGIYFGAKDLLVQFVDELYREFEIYDGKDTYPTISNLYALCRYYKDNAKNLSYRKRDSLDTNIGRLNTLIISLSPLIMCRKGHDLEALYQKDIVFELHGVTNYVQNFLVNLILHWIYNHRKFNNIRWTSPNLALLFDEAKRIFDANAERRPNEPIPSIVSLVDEIRQFRAGLVVSDQEPTKVLKSLKANTFTKITLQMRHGSDIDDMASSMSLTDEQKDMIGVLPPWNAIVKKGPHRPFLCQIPLLEPSRKDVSDNEIDIMMHPELSRMPYTKLTKESLDEDITKYEAILKRDRSNALKPRTAKKPTPKTQKNWTAKVPAKKTTPPKKTITLTDEQTEFLQHIIDIPNLTATERYTLSATGPRKGGRLIKELENLQLIEPVLIKRGKKNRPATYHSATKAAFDILKQPIPKYITDFTHGGFQHRYWKSVVELNLQQSGLNPIIEYHKNGKYADLGCQINGELVAIEIGTSDARNEINNIMNDLDAGFEKVWCICIEEVYNELKKRIETELDDNQKKLVKVTLTYDFFDKDVELPKKRKILFVTSSQVTGKQIRASLDGQLMKFSVKTIQDKNLNDKHVTWAEEIITATESQKDNLNKKYPWIEAKSLSIPDGIQDIEPLLKAGLQRHLGE